MRAGAPVAAFDNASERTRAFDLDVTIQLDDINGTTTTIVVAILASAASDPSRTADVVLTLNISAPGEGGVSHVDVHAGVHTSKAQTLIGPHQPSAHPTSPGPSLSALSPPRALTSPGP